MMRRYLLGILFVMGPLGGPAFAVLEDTKNVTLHSAATADGDGTSIAVNGYDVLGLDIDITNTATVTVQGRSALSGTYRNVTCYNRSANSSSAAASSSTNFQCAVSGLTNVKAPISSCSSCTVTVRGQLTTASSGGAGGGGGGGSAVSVAEDAAHVSGENVVPLGCRRKSTAATSAGTDGDWATVDCTDNGEVRVHIQSTSVGSTSDDDDGTIAAGKTGMSEVIAKPYAYNGTDWKRPTADPCGTIAKTFLPINISTATTTEITPSLAGASTNYYVCSLVLVTNATNIVTLVDDDSDGCGSPTAGMSGGTTTAGWTLAANGGLAFGNGMGSIFKTNGTNRVICLVTSAATQLSGTMTVVAAP